MLTRLLAQNERIESSRGADPEAQRIKSTPPPELEQELSYSVRLVQPFLRVLRTSGKVPDQWLVKLDGLDLDHRLPVAAVHQMLAGIVELTGDPDIGLRAAQECSPGDGGALDYAISSASTVGDAIGAAGRYIRLVNDALDLLLENSGRDATVRLENRVPLPRAGVDFQVGALFRAFSHLWASGAKNSLRVLLSHAAPDATAEYTRTFDGVPVQFGAAFSGFVFDSTFLDARLASADPRLHDVVVRHAESMLEELPRARRLTERVRGAIAAELAGGNPSVTQVAGRLHMSPRTLERKLEREGATFSALLDDLRKRLALRYVGSQDLELAEVAFLLGFSQTTAFHRAFKRWTDETPLNFRRAHRARQQAI